MVLYTFYPVYLAGGRKGRAMFFPFREHSSAVAASGCHDVFGFSIRYKKFEIRFNILNFKPRNLEWYRKDHERYEDID